MVKIFKNICLFWVWSDQYQMVLFFKFDQWFVIVFSLHEIIQEEMLALLLKVTDFQQKFFLLLESFLNLEKFFELESKISYESDDPKHRNSSVCLCKNDRYWHTNYINKSVIFKGFYHLWESFFSKHWKKKIKQG